VKTDPIKQFTKFLDKELMPSVDELEKLADVNRKHVQKLVYTNVVDRFDYLVDVLLLDNCREEVLVSKAFDRRDEPVRESELVKLLLEEADLQSALERRLQDKLRLTALNQRHSRKFRLLLSLCDSIDEYERKPRVNPSTGEIVSSFKIQKRTIPHSICGYADWLYSRRNAVVHGAGSSKFLERDSTQIKKIYRVSLAKTFRISSSSIRTAAAYYKNVCDLIQE
jgi:hypothetical protein